MKEVKGARVLITGGARGMGLLWAERFLADGASVMLWDRDKAALDSAALKLLARHPGKVGAAAVDVSDNEAVRKAAVKCCPKGIDILVNNAGIVRGGKFADLPDEAHQSTIGVNLMSAMWTIKAFLPGMMERRRGHIVNIASAAGFLGTPYMATYNASKWGLIGLTESLKAEMREQGYREIRFTLICPSYVDTGMFSGVKAPLFAPLLDPAALVDKSYRAFKRDRFRLLEPFIVKTIPCLKGILPFSWFEGIGRLIGVNTSMENWKGHGG
jgi:all-trans-retinol dehydrogenase (NAD+)